MPGRARLAEWLWAALAGAALLLASDLLVPPPAAPADGHPANFAAAAVAPFAFDGVFPHRILWPLLAHVAGWLGVGPVAFSQVCCAALLAVVCWFARRRGARWVDAVLVAAAVAGSGAVNVYKPQACQPDPLNLVLLVLTVHFAARPVVFWALVLLAALSHELVFFFAPWLVWLRRAHGGSLLRDGAALAATLAVYAAWRWLAAALAPPGLQGATYDAAYYIAQNFWVPWGMPAMWALWALVVVAEFGPLLALAASGWRGGALAVAMGGRWGAPLYFVCVLSLMLLAYDVFRFATFVFLPVVLGALQLARAPRGRLALAALVVASWIVYARLHPIPSEQGGRAFTDVTGHVRELLLPRVDPTVPGGIRHFGPGDAWDFGRDLLARTWPTFAVAALAAAACAPLGVWLARDTRGAGGRGT